MKKLLVACALLSLATPPHVASPVVAQSDSLGCVIVTSPATGMEPRERETRYCPNGHKTQRIRQSGVWSEAGDGWSAWYTPEPNIGHCTWWQLEQAWSCKSSGRRFTCTQSACSETAAPRTGWKTR